MKPRVVLLAAELGAGRGHLTRLHRAVQTLGSDFEPVWFLRAGDFPLARQIGIKDSISVAPRLPLARRPAGFRRLATLAGPLGDWGFACPEILGAIVGHWVAILREVRPHMIIADFSPFLRLASLGRIPLLMLGSGFTIPPSGSPLLRLPELLPALDGEVSEELRYSENARRVRPDLGLSRLEGLTSVLQGDETALCVWPEVDPYKSSRPHGHWGPLLLQGESGSWIYSGPRRPMSAYAYLHGRTDAQTATLLQLVQIGWRVTVAGARGASADGYLQAVPKPLSPTQIVSAFDVLVHGGGAGLAQIAMSAGLPQMCLPTTAENVLVGRSVAAAGAGTMLMGVGTQSLEAVADAVGSQFEEAAMERRRRLSAKLVNRAASERWECAMASAIRRIV